jgi:hypothetical protein
MLIWGKVGDLKILDMIKSLLFVQLLLLSFTLKGQEIRSKAIFFPLIEHSMGMEVFMNNNFSIQLLFQNQIILGDNNYSQNRFIPSLRYYMISEKRIINNFFFDGYYRLNFIKLNPDQSFGHLFFRTSAAGINLGRKFNLSKVISLEPSYGHYYIFSGDASEDYLFGELFKYHPRIRTRIDLKLGFKIK